MNDAWTITAQPQGLTVTTDETGPVKVTVTGLPRWQVAVSPLVLEVNGSGSYQVKFTVTSRGPELATVVPEAPYVDPDSGILMFSPARFRLDEGRKVVPGSGSVAFTLTVDVAALSVLESIETVAGRVSTAGGDAMFSLR